MAVENGGKHAEYDKVTQASMNGLYVKAKELDRGHNEKDAPTYLPPGVVCDTSTHASDASQGSFDASTHASDASHEPFDVAYVDAETRASDASTHASDA